MKEIRESLIHAIEVYGDPSLNEAFAIWPAKKQEALLDQIQLLEIPVLKNQQREFEKRTETKPLPDAPWEKAIEWGNPLDKLVGEEKLYKGQVGSIVFAGGQGTRLGFLHPKGMFPISPIRKKSLFQLIAERTVAASKAYGSLLPLAIMTSPENDFETKKYFFENKLFGLLDGQLEFFCQKELPWLNDEGKFFEGNSGFLAMAADGNGGAIHAFLESGIAKKWENLGIQLVTTVLIDNPLANPWDPFWIGHHVREKLEALCLTLLREDPMEPVGLLMSHFGKLTICEYTEVPPEKKLKEKAKGILEIPFANISLICWSLKALFKLGARSLNEVPLHFVHKTLGEKHGYHTGWKSERFIFDWLPFLDQVEVMLVPRNEWFAPLKNRTGKASPETVCNALLKRDYALLEQLTKQTFSIPLELSQEFLYLTDEMKKKIPKKMDIQSGYIPFFW